jgi:NAD(P)-dependent dehydrogenase (short-subunit alcohol dehydrogenase family)
MGIGSCCRTRRGPYEEALTSNPALEAQSAARYPVGRRGQPEAIAEAVVWLCSEAASFVTGHTMTVDGG